MLCSAAVISACTTNNESNTATLQGTKNNQLWRSKSAQATISSTNHLIITGYTETETLTIDLNNYLKGEYAIGGDSASKAGFEYTNENGSFAYSSNGASPMGKVIITKTANNLLTGTFYFYMKNTSGSGSGEPAVTNFQHGAFYDLPIQ